MALRAENTALQAGRKDLTAENMGLLRAFYIKNVLVALSGKRDWHLTRGNKMTSTKQAMEKMDYAPYPACADVIYKKPTGPLEDDVC